MKHRLLQEMEFLSNHNNESATQEAFEQTLEETFEVKSNIHSQPD
jgi:hypothetical protein